MEEKFIQGSLRNLIRTCCLDLEGDISKEEILELMPIEQNGVKIWIEDDKMFFMIDDEFSFFIVENEGKFNKLNILKRALFKFNVYLEGQTEIDIIKFQNDILMLLLK